ncbi:hypothetical protein DPMN_006488 [Dreissena polymorpha]|uniref:Uncharacterized protein n=1 Tax=Dreissena polymorpha TaxID=45954 RepID=A0A9D4MRI9_DREPO|nr:hypothetical protein DPMN_006488 [Dreissena polymorpha]
MDVDCGSITIVLGLMADSLLLLTSGFVPNANESLSIVSVVQAEESVATIQVKTCINAYD